MARWPRTERPHVSLSRLTAFSIALVWASAGVDVAHSQIISAPRNEGGASSNRSPADSEKKSSDEGKSTSETIDSDSFEKYLAGKAVDTTPNARREKLSPLEPDQTVKGNGVAGDQAREKGNGIGTNPEQNHSALPRQPMMTHLQSLPVNQETGIPRTGGNPGYYQPRLTTDQPGVELYQPEEVTEVPDYPPGAAIGWWENRGMGGAMRPLLTSHSERVVYVDLEQLVWQSLQHSKKIKSALKIPQIQRTEIDVAKGELDPRTYAKSNFKDTSDPVGNTLTTGGPNRLNEYFWENSVGITDRNSFGGKVDLGQAINARDSNSLFFKPNNQVDSKLTINYTQPLMRGSGLHYNTSMIRINQIKERGSIANANKELQDHAMAIQATYWQLVQDRFHMVQSINARHRLLELKKELENRRGRDLIGTQISQANTAIGTQESQIELLKGAIKGNQAVLATLVGSPELQKEFCDEMIPLTFPVAAIPADEMFADEYCSAPLYRGDILAIQYEIEVESVRKSLAVNELKPSLDMVLEGYLRGLAGDARAFQSFLRQFDTGSPSYGAGFVYQNPVNQRAAKANLRGRTLSLEQLRLRYESELDTARAQIDKAIANTKGTYRSIFASLRATNAAKEEIELYLARLDDFFGETSTPGNLLKELLDAEARLVAAEKELASRQIEHMLALVQVKYESGTLLAIGSDLPTENEAAP